MEKTVVCIYILCILYYVLCKTLPTTSPTTGKLGKLREQWNYPTTELLNTLFGGGSKTVSLYLHFSSFLLL